MPKEPAEQIEVGAVDELMGSSIVGPSKETLLAEWQASVSSYVSLPGQLDVAQDRVC